MLDFGSVYTACRILELSAIGLSIGHWCVLRKACCHFLAQFGMIEPCSVLSRW
jgi:hypothetical protein